MSLGSSIYKILNARRQDELRNKEKSLNEFILNNQLALARLKEELIEYYTNASPNNVEKIIGYQISDFNGIRLKDDQELCYNLKRYLVKEDLITIPIRRDSLICTIIIIPVNEADC